MSGVIDEDGQQWEHCDGCTKFVKIEELLYEQPTGRYKYGRDLCKKCMGLVRNTPGEYIAPDPGEVAARKRVAEKIRAEMQGKEYVFKQSGPNTWDAHIVDVN